MITTEMMNKLRFVWNVKGNFFLINYMPRIALEACASCRFLKLFMQYVQNLKNVLLSSIDCQKTKDRYRSDPFFFSNFSFELHVELCKPTDKLNFLLQPLKRKYLRLSSQATIQILRKYVAKKLKLKSHTDVSINK